MTNPTNQKSDYFALVVEITEKYLGPAAERFIRRQIEFHLQKVPEEINYKDITKIKNNVGVALGLLVNDRKMVNQAVNELGSIKK